MTTSLATKALSRLRLVAGNKGVKHVLSALYLTVIAFAHSVHAYDIKIIDQHGQAVINAYVALPEGEIIAPKTEVAVMDQVSVRFDPHVLAVDAGQAVVFPNSDNIRHHVYSFSEPKRFEIKLYEGVPKSPVLFENPGLVVLGCNIHDSMLGYIFVSPWPEYLVTDASGAAKLSKQPKQIAVWHPWLQGQQSAMMIDINSDDSQASTITLELTKPGPKRSFGGLRKRYDD